MKEIFNSNVEYLEELTFLDETETKQQKEPNKKLEVSNESWLSLKSVPNTVMLLHR